MPLFLEDFKVEKVVIKKCLLHWFLSLWIYIQEETKSPINSIEWEEIEIILVNQITKSQEEVLQTQIQIQTMENIRKVKKVKEYLMKRNLKNWKKITGTVLLFLGGTFFRGNCVFIEAALQFTMCAIYFEQNHSVIALYHFGKWYGVFKTDHITSDFLKAVFRKFY